jgi:hypothetical protein
MTFSALRWQPEEEGKAYRFANLYSVSEKGKVRSQRRSEA